MGIEKRQMTQANEFSPAMDYMHEHYFVKEIDAEGNLIDRCINCEIGFAPNGRAK